MRIHHKNKETGKQAPIGAENHSVKDIASTQNPLWAGLAIRDSAVLALAAVIITTLLTFHRVPSFNFVIWDDGIHVYENPYLRSINVNDIPYFWLHSYQGLYVPLSYSVYCLLSILAYRPDGVVGLTLPPGATPLDPNVFHTANLLLHLLNIVLVFFLLRRMSRNDLSSVFGTLIFAVHPLQVESVAWVSELRGLLSGFFSLLAIHLYLDYAGSQRQSRRPLTVVYVASVLFAVAAMLSKPSSVVIGLIIAAIGLWVYKRNWRAVVWDVVPYGVAGVAAMLITSHVQLVPPRQIVSVWLRPLIAGQALAFYLEKFFAPFNLTIDYGQTPTWVLLHRWAVASGLLPLSVACVAYMLRKHAPSLAFGSTVAVVFLLPVLGLTPFVYQEHSTTADRYAYLALLGPAIIVACGLPAIPARGRKIVEIALAFCLIGFCVLTERQTLFWRSSEPLFEHAVQVVPTSAVSQSGLGTVFIDRGEPSLAAVYFSRAVRLDPSDASYVVNLGSAYSQLNDNSSAGSLFRQAIALEPRYAPAYYSLGVLLLHENKPIEGVPMLQKALQLEPTDSPTARALGDTYVTERDYGDADTTFTEGLRYNPRDSELWRALGISLFAEDRLLQAEGPLENAIALNPTDQLAAKALNLVQRQLQSAN